MHTELTILTGHSRGMGRAMAQRLLSQGHLLLGISRGRAQGLAPAAGAAGELIEWQADLADGPEVARRLQSWLEGQAALPWRRVTLINNAGLIPAIVPLSRSQPEDLARALRVDLETPMQLCAVVLAATANWPAQRRILNISSGLGRRPMASQSAYCAAKAGMDHFTRCLALDEARMPNGARVCSLAPGVIDTEMQMQLRGAPDPDFPDRQGFEGLYQQGMLSTPDDAAERLLAFLARPDFGQQPVADVRS
ncbi:MAG: SDR family NAD(P)-dependent oxidoreductase [Betaproteobacteria bacterium]